MRILAAFALFVCVCVAQTAPAPKSSPAKPAPKTSTTNSKTSPTAAPDPDEGSLDERGVYTSDFFRFSYTLPEGFDVDENFLADLEDQSKSTYVLLAAEGPLSGEDRRDVVVILADHEATTAEAYIEKVSRDYAQKQSFEVLKPAYAVTIAGKPFVRADFRKEGTYQTAVFTILKGYAVGFSLAAPNAEAMDVLTQSLNSVKFLTAKSPTAKPPVTGTKPTNPAVRKPPTAPKAP